MDKTIELHRLKKHRSKIHNKISLTGQFSAVDEVLEGAEKLKLIASLRDVKNCKHV